MTTHVYRYKRDRPTATPILTRLIGTTVLLVAVGNGAIFDIQLDDEFLPDADEALGALGFSRIETDPTTSADKHRVVGYGSTTVSANSTVTLGTFTRSATERVRISGFVTNDVAGAAFFDGSAAALSDSVALFCDRTANPNEFRARATNGNLISARTVEWLVEAILP